MSRNGLLVLGLLVIATMATIVLWPEETPELEDLFDVDQSLEQEQPPEVAETEPTNLAISSVAKVADSSLRKESESVESIPSNYAVEDMVTVVVVDKESGEHVPNANVYYLNQTKVDQKEIQSFSKGKDGYSPIMRKFGKKYLTNANGVAMIPPIDGRTTLFGEKDGKSHLFHSVPEESETFRLTLEANISLLVMVVDGQGAPVPDAPISISMDHGNYVNNWKEAKTDQDGIHKWEDLRQILKSRSGRGGLLVGLNIPMSKDQITEQQKLKLTDEVLATGEVHLVMPALGKLRITVLDSSGKLYTGSGNVKIREEIVEYPYGFGPYPISEPISDGVAEFEMIGLFAKLEASFSKENSGNQDPVAISGPQSSNEWTEATITLHDRPVLTGILLSPDNKPLLDKDISFRITRKRGGGRSSSSSSIKTDSNGRFRYEFTSDRNQNKEAKVTIEFEHEIGKFGKCKYDHAYEGMLAPITHDLGELTLQPEPSLLAGRVVDMNENPIPGARVTAKAIDPNHASDARITMFGGESTKTDEDGYFRCQGKLESANTYRVSINAKGFATLDQDISLGSEGVIFHLLKSAVMIGSIKLNEEVDSSRLNLIFVEGENKNSVRPSQTGDPTTLGIRFEGKPNATYFLEVRTQNNRLIYQSGNFVMLEGAETKPTEFQPLDLRGVLNQITIKAVSSAGKELRATIYCLVGESSWSGESGGVEGTKLLAVDSFEKLYVQVNGYAGKLLENVNSDQEVILEKGIEVYVQLPSNLIGYRDVVFTIDAYSNSRDHEIPFSSRTKATPIDSSGRATLTADRTGEYNFRLRIRSPKEGVRRGGTSMRVGSYDLKASGQVISLEVDLEELDKRIDKLSAND